MMPGGSSATPGDTPKQEPPMSLLGATGRARSVALDESTEVKGKLPRPHIPPSLSLKEHADENSIVCRFG